MKSATSHFQSSNVLSQLTKIVIFLLLMATIYQQIFLRQDFDAIWQSFQQHIGWESSFSLLLVMGLMLVNWGIESVKWQRLMIQLEQLHFITAFKAVLCGVTLSLFTPNRVGEYGGRVLILKKAKKLDAIAITLVSSLSQLIGNSLLGVLGFCFFCLQFTPFSPSLVILVSVFSLLTILLLLLFYYRMKWLATMAKYIPYFQKFVPYIQLISRYNSRELSQILGLSILRYLTFSLQYYFLLQLFDVQISIMDAMLFVNSIFLIQTIIPSIAIVELGIRGNVALFFAGYIAANPLGVTAATFSLWAINLVIPALIGLLFIWNIQFFKAADNKSSSS